MICQSHLPLKPWMNEQARRLPGLRAIPMEEWLVLDEVFSAQMALRDALIKSHAETVYASMPNVDESCRELLKFVIDAISHNDLYRIERDKIIRPDGVCVNLDWDNPLKCAGRLVQEDFLILQPGQESLKSELPVHQIIAGILCFPAGWRLADKIARPLSDVHKDIKEYTDDIATRVERVLCNLLPEKLVMRTNYLVYTNPELHQPNEEGTAKIIEEGAPRFVRVERQTLRRLPTSKAIIFSIHTYCVPAALLVRDDYVALLALRPELGVPLT